jgi:uncharacterized protein YecE (DUF72 family)
LALAEMRKTLRPLQEADKLGYVLFQMAQWVKRTDEAMEGMADLPRWLPDTVIAVEFRNRSWFGEHTERRWHSCGKTLDRAPSDARSS